MASVNRVILIGRLTADPEPPKVLPNSGTTLVKFRMAVGRSRKNPQTGQWENDPNPLYIDCEVFSKADQKRNLADVVTRYVKRGDELYCEGRLQLDEWEDKNGGGKRSKHKIVVDSIELLGGKGGGESKEPINHEDPGETMAPRQPARQTQQSRPAVQPVEDDGIPF